MASLVVGGLVGFLAIAVAMAMTAAAVAAMAVVLAAAAAVGGGWLIVSIPHWPGLVASGWAGADLGDLASAGGGDGAE